MNLFKKFNVDKDMTSKRVEEIGQSFIKAGRYCMTIGLYSLGLFLLILLIAAVVNGATGILYALAFDFDGYEIGIPFMGLSYMGMMFGILGVPMYFIGLNIFALGRIAHNTEKEQSDISDDTLPEL